MKIKLFTHTDLDGAGCAILGILAFGKENIDIEYCNYDDINLKVKSFVDNQEYKNYDFVYITDISVADEIAAEIENTHPDNFKEGFNLAEMFQLLDHHPTALGLNKYWWCHVKTDREDGKTSGTELFFEEINYDNIVHKDINKQNIIHFVETVRQYDTWEWRTKYNNEEPKMWNDLLYIMGREEFISQMVYKLTMYNTFDFNSIEEMLLRIEEQKKQKYFEQKEQEMIIKPFVKDYESGVYRAGFVFAEQYHSELGNVLAERHPEIDFIVLINSCKSISYRTIKDNIDLGKDIASIYGGGGHPKAAGSQISKKLMEDIIIKIFE